VAEDNALPSRGVARWVRPINSDPRGKPGFLTYESAFGRETDSPLEEEGFEPSVPVRGTTLFEHCAGSTTRQLPSATESRLLREGTFTDHGMRWDNSGKNGHYAPISWSN
jgi:hypothetical protein